MDKQNKKPNIAMAAIFDFIAIILILVILVILVNYIYSTFNISGKIMAICFIIACPIVWGILGFIIVKKKTPGYIIASKLAEKKNNSNKTQ